MDRGITLAGGGSLLQGLEQRLRDECQMPCQLAESPLTCVAVGSGLSLEEFEAIHRASKNSGSKRYLLTSLNSKLRFYSVYRKQVRRRRAVLALLVLSSFALLTATYGQQSGGLQRGVSAVFGPLQEGADRALKPARDLVNWFDETFDARGENDRLQRRRSQQLRTQVAAGETALSENDQLRKLLGLRAAGELPLGFEPVTGRVIARSPTVWYSTVTIDHGTSAGVAVNDPVISGDGLVGRITSATRRDRAGDADHRPHQRRHGEGRPGGDPGRDQARGRQPRATCRSTSSTPASTCARARPSSPRAGRRGGCPRSIPYGIPLGRVTEATRSPSRRRASRCTCAPSPTCASWSSSRC